MAKNRKGAKHVKAPAHKYETFLDCLLRCIKEAVKKEKLDLTDNDIEMLRCLLYTLAQRITKEYTLGHTWPTSQ